MGPAAAETLILVLVAVTASEATGSRLGRYGDDVLPNDICGTRPGYSGRRRRGSNVRQNLGRIIGGVPAKVGQFRWQALVSCSLQAGAGGVVISKRAVLTAAHVMYRIDDCWRWPESFLVVLGILDWKKNRTNLDNAWFIEDYIMHPAFNHRTLANDLAVVFLNRSVIFNDVIQPACLPTPDTPDAILEIGQQALVSGWGLTAPAGQVGPPRHLLRYTGVRVGDLLKCRRIWSQRSNHDIRGGMHICAGVPDNGRRTCNGDSGSGLVSRINGRWFALGVISFGYRNCDNGDVPDVYAGVRYQIQWIVEALRDFMNRLNP